MNIKYKIVVGEKGNNMGHVVSCKVKTDIGAKRILTRELAKYNGDGWGRIEYTINGECWQKL